MTQTTLEGVSADMAYALQRFHDFRKIPSREYEEKYNPKGRTYEQLCEESDTINGICDAALERYNGQ